MKFSQKVNEMSNETEYISIDMETSLTDDYEYSPARLAELFKHEDDLIFRHESQLIFVANILMGVNAVLLTTLTILMIAGA